MGRCGDLVSNFEVRSSLLQSRWPQRSSIARGSIRGQARRRREADAGEGGGYQWRQRTHIQTVRREDGKISKHSQRRKRREGEEGEEGERRQARGLGGVEAVKGALQLPKIVGSPSAAQSWRQPTLDPCPVNSAHSSPACRPSSARTATERWPLDRDTGLARRAVDMDLSPRPALGLSLE